MLNRSVYFAGDTNIKVNAISGGIVKNHKDSYFRRFHLKSDMAEKLLSPCPYRMIKNKSYPYDEKQFVEVLQMVVVGDMEVVAEIIDIPKEENDK